jgi:3-oxoacyl-[acyl-carrier protein] reductase
VILEGRVALVTGASSGIGSATALALAAEGAKVGVNYLHNRQGADGVVEAIVRRGGEALAIQADVSRGAEVESMVRTVRERWGQIDILVNNAGDPFGTRMLADMTEDFWDQVMDVNLKSIFLCVKAVWEEMAARKNGCIINISSIAARTGGRVGGAAYAAAKGGMLTYTKTLAKELAPKGVRVNGIAPGLIATPFHERHTSPELFQKMVEAIPLGRAGTAADIADVVVFLASPAARYISGQMLDVNGGLWMN